MRRVLAALLLLALLLPACAAATPSAAKPSPMRIAFVRQGHLWLWDNGRERRLTKEPGVRSPRFSHDGRFITYWQDRRLNVIRADGKGPWRLNAKEPFYEVAWSPTENRLALADQTRTVTVDVTQNGPQGPYLVVDGWSGTTWSPDGERLAVGQVERGEQPMTGTARVAILSRTHDDPRVILEDPFAPGKTEGCGAGARPAAWSPDGEWLLLIRPGATPSIAADCNEYVVVSTRGGEPERLGASPNPGWAVWSPAAPLLALTNGASREAYRSKEILLTSPPWQEARNITPPGYADREPAWSPGSSYLAFTRSLDKRPERTDLPAPGQAIYATRADSLHPQKIPGSEGGFCPFWGQDGTLLWFQEGEIRHRRDDLPNPLLQAVDMPPNYYGQWDCAQVLDHWIPAPPYSRP